MGWARYRWLWAVLCCGQLWAKPMFEDLGEPVRVRSLQFEAVTRDPAGYYVAWAPFLENGLGRTALAGVRLDTGDEVYVDLSRFGQGKLAMTLGADGNLYAYAGDPGHFWRYRVATHALDDLGAPTKHASYWANGALGTDGRWYVGSYPRATLVCCDTRTGQVSDLGRMTDDDREAYIYPTVAVSNEQVVYCPVGLHHKELWAYDTRTGRRQQILPDSLTSQQGTVVVHTGVDGQVYGTAGKLQFRCRPDRIEPGQTAAARRAPPLTIGDEQVGALVDGRLTLTNPRTKAERTLTSNFRGVRAFIFSVACERNGKIYGSSCLPGHTFTYDVAAGKLADLGIIDSGKCQVYDTISLPRGLFLASYFGAWIDFWDPDQPLRPDQNPRRVGHVAEQERPLQWCLGPDGMLYSGTEPAKGRLGGALLQVDPEKLSLRSWPTPIANQSIEYVAPVPETGELFCTTSIRGGSSARPSEKSACVFLWDTKTSAMTFRAEPLGAIPDYGRAVRGNDGLIYGVAPGRYYVFDPRARRTVFTGDLPVRALRFPGLCDEPVGPQGLLYGLGDDAVFVINPADRSAKVVARDVSIGGGGGRRPAHGFMVTGDGVLYYGSGATLMRYRLP